MKQRTNGSERPASGQADVAGGWSNFFSGRGASVCVGVAGRRVEGLLCDNLRRDYSQELAVHGLLLSGILGWS